MDGSGGIPAERAARSAGGNSGNSLAPHLRFGLLDGLDPGTSNSVPFVLDRYTVTGAVVHASYLAAFTATGPLRLRSDTTPVPPSGRCRSTSLSSRCADAGAPQQVDRPDSALDPRRLRPEAGALEPIPWVSGPEIDWRRWGRFRVLTGA